MLVAASRPKELWVFQTKHFVNTPWSFSGQRIQSGWLHYYIGMYIYYTAYFLDYERRQDLSIVQISIFIKPCFNNLSLGVSSYILDHNGAENFKKSRPKKLVKSNKSISRKNSLNKFHFLQFQKWPKINFWTEKKI